MALTRRSFIAAMSSAAVGAAVFPRHGLAGGTRPAVQARILARLQALEAEARGRLGVHILDTADGATYGYRADERFQTLSSFKFLASALVLHRVDRGLESLDRRIPIAPTDLITWSPVTEKHVGGAGMSLAALCDATITTSDNAAANLILDSYGGPAALTAYLRTLGDSVTRIDRREPELNVKHPDEPMDTTTPRAMVMNLHKLVLGDALSAASRALLTKWLEGNTTGGKRLRAGLPDTWRVGEKTGTFQTDANDSGVVWPPERAPLLVSAYLADSPVDNVAKDATLAEVGRVVREIVG
jgi:beta-lactamase class A